MQDQLLVQAGSHLRPPTFYFAISILALLFILVLEPTYNQSLFDRSITDIINIQADTTSGGRNVMVIYTNLSLSLINFLPIFCCYLVYNQRARCFYYVLLITALLALMNLFKLSYHDPRPFWASADV